MSETAAKKDTAKLQRAIIDGLEDVKAQDIAVFDTEHLSSLFERVIVASGTSNRQTKALASSVRDAVREAGFAKPRVEGESNGEWIIVDCGPCVVHVMQPAIRTYYHLEEIWGEKPVRMKLGAAKPAMPSAAPVAPAKKSKEPTLRRSSAAKTAIKAQEQIDRAEKASSKRKPAAKKAPPRATNAKSVLRGLVKTASKPASKPAPKTAAKPASKPPMKVVGKPTVKAAVKTAVKKPAKAVVKPRKA